MEKRVLIVGAGIAGLTAGCYSSQNGYRTTILESHSIPGGLCTAWKRKGYTFDISMHMLTGAVSGPFHRMWQELGVIENFDFHTHDHFTAVEAQGKRIVLSTDRKILESRLLELAPGDAKKIREFTKLIFGRDFMNAASLSPASLTSFRDKLSTFLTVVPNLGPMMRYGKKTVQEFADEFTDPFVKEVMRLFIDAPGWPMVDFPLAFMMGFAKVGVTEAPAPLGGSQRVMNHLADRFQKSGGELRFNCRVSDVMIEENRAVGLVLDDGTRYEADEIIWAGDGHSLIFDILNGRYMDRRIETMYRDWIAVKPVLHVMMGVDLDFSDEPHRIIFEPEEPVRVAGRPFDRLSVIHHCFDPSMAPRGKSAVEVWYDTDFDYWENLSKDRPGYSAEKNRIADETIRQLDKRWPGFASAVEVVDVPTPATYKRFTGNWKGSPDGWYITSENGREMDAVRTLPGLKGLTMIGQWTVPFAGTVTSALTGRQAVELMCHRDERPFATGYSGA